MRPGTAALLLDRFELLPKEAIGHAGKVVGDGAFRPDGFSTLLELGRQSIEVPPVVFKEAFQVLLRLASAGDQLRVAVDSLEEKPFEFAFAFGQGGAGADRDRRFVRFAGRPEVTLAQFRDAVPEYVADLQVDQFVHDGTAEHLAVKRAESLGDTPMALPDEFHFLQFIEFEQSEFHGVIDVVGIVGDAIGHVDDLGFEQGPVFAGFLVNAALLALQHFACEVESFVVRVGPFEFTDEGEGELVVGEAAVEGQAFGEGVFAGVAEGRMSDIVQQGEGFNEVLVQAHGAAHGARDRGDFHGMREACAVVVAHGAGEDLGLAAESAEGGRVQDAVTVTLEGTAIGVFRFRVFATGGVGVAHGVVGERAIAGRRGVGV